MYFNTFPSAAIQLLPAYDAPNPSHGKTDIEIFSGMNKDGLKS
jgi:hypothetical protein